MKCQRCLSDEEATYRTYTEAMDVKVCGTCAEEAGSWESLLKFFVLAKEKIPVMRVPPGSKTNLY